MSRTLSYSVPQGSLPAGFNTGGQVYLMHGHVPRVERPLQDAAYAPDSELIRTAVQMDTFDEALDWAIGQVTGGPLYRYGSAGVAPALLARWDTDRYLTHSFADDEYERWEQAAQADTTGLGVLQRRRMLVPFLCMFTIAPQSVSDTLRRPLPRNEDGEAVVGRRNLALIHLWWDARRDEGYPRETAWMLLRMMLPTQALAMLRLPAEGPPVSTDHVPT